MSLLIANPVEAYGFHDFYIKTENANQRVLAAIFHRAYGFKSESLKLACVHGSQCAVYYLTQLVDKSIRHEAYLRAIQGRHAEIVQYFLIIGLLADHSNPKPARDG